MQIGICLNDTKKYSFLPKKYKHLEWTEGKGDTGKECTSTEKTWTNIDTETEPHECSSSPVYYN